MNLGSGGGNKIKGKGAFNSMCKGKGAKERDSLKVSPRGTFKLATFSHFPSPYSSAFSNPPPTKPLTDSEPFSRRRESHLHPEYKSHLFSLLTESPKHDRISRDSSACKPCRMA